MKNKNLIMAIAAALYSPSFYREVCQRWRGRAFTYLLVLLAVVWIFISFSKTLDFCMTINQVADVVSSQMPELSFQAGVAKTKNNEPVFMRWSADSEPFAVIDTHNQYKNFKGGKAQILVRDKYIVLKKSQHEVTTYTFPTHLTGKLGPANIKTFLQMHSKEILAITFFSVFVVGLVLIYVWTIILSLIFALLGMIFVALNKVRLDYSSVLAMTMVALTPAVLLQSLFVVAGISFMFQFWLLALITLIYIFVAVRVNKSE